VDSLGSSNANAGCEKVGEPFHHLEKSFTERFFKHLMVFLGKAGNNRSIRETCSRLLIGLGTMAIGQ